ncbi:MAG: hypothetical protein KF863_21040 [Rubrivivax sp.]|nr:hypothetical protein [Rubrivivax sp.]
MSRTTGALGGRAAARSTGRTVPGAVTRTSALLRRGLHGLRPLLPPATLVAVTLAGALAVPASAPAGGLHVIEAAAPFDAEPLVQCYDRWWAGLDGGAAAATHGRAHGAAAAPQPPRPCPPPRP